MNVYVGDFEKLSDKLKLMAHPVRLCILAGLLKKGECNVTYIQESLDTPQPTISQHLQKLKSYGLVKSRRHGVEIFYSVADKDVSKIVDFMSQNLL